METATQTLAGAWTEYRTQISEQEKEIFNAALKGLLGVEYTPVAVASQVVAGYNYSFFCNARVVHPHATNEAALVGIYLPPDGKPRVTGIQPLDHHREAQTR